MLTMMEMINSIKQNPSLLDLYRKKNCNTCSGKGYKISIKKGLLGNVEEKIICHCVIKNIKKEIQKLNDNNNSNKSVNTTLENKTN